MAMRQKGGIFLFCIVRGRPWLLPEQWAESDGRVSLSRFPSSSLCFHHHNLLLFIRLLCVFLCVCVYMCVCSVRICVTFRSATKKKEEDEEGEGYNGGGAATVDEKEKAWPRLDGRNWQEDTAPHGSLIPQSLAVNACRSFLPPYAPHFLLLHLLSLFRFDSFLFLFALFYFQFDGDIYPINALFIFFVS